MPAEKKPRVLPAPWKEFLGELDRMLHEPLQPHCIGGFVFNVIRPQSAAIPALQENSSGFASSGENCRWEHPIPVLVRTIAQD